MSKSSSQSAPEARVVIIGAGLAGIATALALKTRLHFENFRIYEKAPAVGGVWRDNTYPGCASDVPGHWYSLSTELNPHWKTYYPSQPEIRAYWEELWTRYNVDAHTVLDTEVVEATWDDLAQLYHVTVENQTTGARTSVDAQVVVWAAGGFHAPLYPKDVPGVREFKGPVWHSAQWNHDVDLKDMRVGVIGNGCSAAQFVPRISEDPSVQVVNFVRSAQWYTPRHQYTYSSWAKWMFAHVPFAMRVYRSFLMARTDVDYFAFARADSFIQTKAREEMTRYIKMKAPKEYHDELIPKYPPGCKRVIVDPSYLMSLARPNISLNWTPIDTVVEEGIKLKTGEVVPLDAIIFATGFSLMPARLEIKGTKETLSEYWKAQGGATAYLGLAVPTFPNLFMLLGPNSAGGHASVIFNEEVQLQHALRLIKPIIQGKAKSFAVREDVSDKYNAWIQSRITASVWNFCTSYYRADGMTGKNIAVFPGPITLFWWLARRPRWSDYNAVGAERLVRERRLRAAGRWSTMLLLASFLLSGFFAHDSVLLAHAHAAEFADTIWAGALGFLKTTYGFLKGD